MEWGYEMKTAAWIDSLRDSLFGKLGAVVRLPEASRFLFASKKQAKNFDITIVTDIIQS